MEGKKWHQEYYLKNKEKINKYSQKYYQEHKEEYKKRSKEYIRKHKIHYRNLKKKYVKKNFKKVQEISRQWKKKNKLHILEYQRKYIKIYRQKLNNKIAFYYSNRIRLALKGIVKDNKTVELLGCSIKQLKNHLEKKFTNGMSWSNYGKWHIDHIRPCASFNLRKESEQYKCFNYTNLQPLWAKENQSKNCKIINLTNTK